MAKGENIFRRRDGRWEARYSKGRELSGKIKYGYCYGKTYVLTGTDAFMEPRVLQYRLEKYTQACGLEGVHFHTLRHTFATRAVEVGFEIKSLSEILGHASVTITLDRYVHSSLELKRDNMQKLNAAGM